MSAKKKRALAAKNRQKMALEKPPLTTTVVINEKPTMEDLPPTSSSLTSSATDVRQYPANIRLNMLTGQTNLNSSRSLTSSNSSMTGDRSKDAIVRINELIRQESLPDIQEGERRRSAEFSPIEYYINETDKLTKNLTETTANKPSTSMEKLTRVHEEGEEVRIDLHCLRKYLEERSMTFV